MAGETVLVRRAGDAVVHVATRAPGVLVVYPPACGVQAVGWYVADAIDAELCRRCVELAARTEMAGLREGRA